MSEIAQLVSKTHVLSHSLWGGGGGLLRGTRYIPVIGHSNWGNVNSETGE